MNTSQRVIQVTVDLDKFLFHAKDVEGHALTMDMRGKLGGGGGEGFQARELLLIGLTGCSGASFLREMRRAGKKPRSLRMTVSGEIDTKAPRVYRKIHVNYVVEGDGLDDELMRRAALACYDDCSVSSTLEHVAHIETTYQVVDAVSRK